MQPVERQPTSVGAPREAPATAGPPADSLDTLVLQQNQMQPSARRRNLQETEARPSQSLVQENGACGPARKPRGVSPAPRTQNAQAARRSPEGATSATWPTRELPKLTTQMLPDLPEAGERVVKEGTSDNIRISGQTRQRDGRALNRGSREDAPQADFVSVSVAKSLPSVQGPGEKHLALRSRVPSKVI